MALEDVAVLDLIKSMVRLEAKVDGLIAAEKEDKLEDSSEDEVDMNDGEDIPECDNCDGKGSCGHKGCKNGMNWRHLLGADAGMFSGGHSVNTAMADSSYDSSTGTYDGLPRTGAYNGGYGL